MNDGRFARVFRAAAVASLCAAWGGTTFGGSPSGPVGNREGTIPPALDAPKPCPTDAAVVQLALLLDTSNSMDGLIDQARSHLWAVVNDLARLRHDCKPVQLQVALFQYGNDRLESSDGFVQLRAPFTTDLDVISEQLFALKTNGGSEYCGWVIRDAAERLAWLPPGDDAAKPPILRLIVIAGNEPLPRDRCRTHPRSRPRRTRGSRFTRSSAARRPREPPRSGTTARRSARAASARSTRATNGSRSRRRLTKRSVRSTRA